MGLVAKRIVCSVAVALLAASCASTETADWAGDSGKSLAAEYKRDMTRRLVGRDIGDALETLKADGYDCATGEAHEAHPDPISVCRKSFATRACQTDWEVTLSPRKAVVRNAETEFTRDCVGVDRDWPAPKRSAIDDGLASAPER